jgi:hypothetical protein
MAAIANSKPSPISEKAVRLLTVALVAVAAAVLSACAVWLSFHQGWTLYYGDAESHLNIARRIIDSRTPGYGQIGTAWLPLPHLLLLPFVARNDLWQSGLAGAIPSAVCFVLAVTFVFAAARRVFKSSAAAATGTALFALNPNVLYLQSTPMNEPIFFAAFAALLYFTVRFRSTQSLWSVAGAGVAAIAGSLTRYEGWFVIPFTAIYFLVAAQRRRIRAALLFGILASLGPLAWLTYNWWLFRDPLEFYWGPYSAKAIQGSAPYPGNGDWKTALIYFGWAARACAGAPLFFAGALGVLAAFWKRAFWPVSLLLLPAVFYIWSIHSSGNPIFLPNLEPHSYYNSRYGLALLPLLGFCAASMAAVPVKPVLRIAVSFILIAVASAPWLMDRRPEAWITWKESDTNSSARRHWTAAAAEFFERWWRPGAGVFTSFGDYTGVYRKAGIPLRATLTGDNGLPWTAATLRPDLFLWEQWAMVMGGDPVQTAINRSRRRGPNYDLMRRIITKGAPVIEIYERRTAPATLPPIVDENSLPQSARREE